MSGILERDIDLSGLDIDKYSRLRQKIEIGNKISPSPMKLRSG
jgi:hypothetical protein